MSVKITADDKEPRDDRVMPEQIGVTLPNPRTTDKMYRVGSETVFIIVNGEGIDNLPIPPKQFVEFESRGREWVISAIGIEGEIIFKREEQHGRE